MDNLEVNDLRIELSLRGVATANMKKPELEKEFNELRGGIVNVLALLQGIPETPLCEIGLEHYEISPVEPLHDIIDKGRERDWKRGCGRYEGALRVTSRT